MCSSDLSIVAQIGGGTDAGGGTSLGGRFVRNDVRSAVLTLVDQAPLEAGGDIEILARGSAAILADISDEPLPAQDGESAAAGTNATTTDSATATATTDAAATDAAATGDGGGSTAPGLTLSGLIATNLVLSDTQAQVLNSSLKIGRAHV